MGNDSELARLFFDGFRVKKKVIIILLIVLGNFSYSQERIKIKETTWVYEIPKGFEITSRGLEDKIQSGEDYLESTSEHETSKNDVILLSLVKNDSSDINRILVSYKSNVNIRNLSLQSYATKLGEFFEKNTGDEIGESQSSVAVTKQYIGDILFYCITKKVTLPENDYTYYSQYYVSEIDEKEFSIVSIYDNEADSLLITKSITKSIFQ